MLGFTSDVPRVEQVSTVQCFHNSSPFHHRYKTQHHFVTMGRSVPRWVVRCQDGSFGATMGRSVLGWVIQC